jgi:hypothetical protein
MRGRLFIGAAALFGAVGIGGEAQAACSDYLNQARRSTDRGEVERLHSEAARERCLQPVIQGIQRRLAELSPEGVNAPKPDDVASAPAPAPAPRPEPPRPAESYRQLVMGRVGGGALTASSAVDENNVPYDMWSFRADAGERLQVTMTAPEGSALDTYLVVGRMRDGRFEEIASNDDRGDGTLNSMVRFTPEETGNYVIRARSFWQEQYGAYELLVQSAASLPAAVAVPRPLALDEQRVSTLGPDSPVDTEGGGYSYELWTFQAAAGQRLHLSMASYDFDPYLVVGRMRDGRFEEIVSNDDRGDGTLNSQVRFVPQEAGEYMIRARSYGAEQYGNYLLMVQSTASVAARVPIDRAASAWVLQGEISTEDGAQNYADFEFPAARGRRYSVRAVSTGFSPIVDVGLLRDGGGLAEVDFFGARDREPNAAEFSAGNRGRYIVRVTAPALSGGSFDLIISEMR